MSDLPQAKKRNRAILAFFATSLASRGIGIACQLLQVPIALGFLHNEAFGLWVTLFSFNFILGFTDFGIGLGVQNRVAEAFGAGDRDRARRVFFTGLVFLTGIMLGLMAILAPFCAYYNLVGLLKIADPGLIASVNAASVIVSLVWCLNVPLGLGQRLAYGAQLGWAHNAATTVSQVVMLGAVALGAHWRVSITTYFVMTFASGAAVNLGFLLWLLHRVGWLRLAWRDFQPSYLRELSHLGFFFFLQQIANIVLFTAPPLILSTTLGAASVTPFNLTQRLLNLFMVVTNAALVPIWPAYAEAKAQADWSWIRRTLHRSLGIVIAMAVLPMIALGPFVPALITRWTRAAAELPSMQLVWLLVAWNALTVLQQPFGYFLAGMSEVKRATVYSILSTVAALSAIYSLIPRFGSSALPMGLMAGFVPFIFCGNIVETFLVLRRHGDKPAGHAVAPVHESKPAPVG